MSPFFRSLPVTLLFLGCELLKGSGASGALMPSLDFSGATLVSAPSAREVAAYYCPRIYDDPFVAAGCAATIGPVPQDHEMQFHFELRYAIDNPNRFPIPTTEMLAAIEVFEGRDIAELGAVCVVFCAPNDVQCNGEPRETSCRASAADITSIDDVFDKALPNLLLLTLDAAINGDLDNLAQRVIPATTEGFEIRVIFSLGLEAMLKILEEAVPQLVDKFFNNQPLDLEIPYMVRGTIWFEIPLLGRVALSYGAFKDVWVIGVDEVISPSRPDE